MDLIARAKVRKAYCCKCGCFLESWTGPLANAFIMDREGNYYCTRCDGDFEDGDERIFELDLEEDK